VIILRPGEGCVTIFASCIVIVKFGVAQLGGTGRSFLSTSTTTIPSILPFLALLLQSFLVFSLRFVVREFHLFIRNLLVVEVRRITSLQTL
jgi:hypothetical protein